MKKVERNHCAHGPKLGDATKCDGTGLARLQVAGKDKDNRRAGSGLPESPNRLGR